MVGHEGVLPEEVKEGEVGRGHDRFEAIRTLRPSVTRARSFVVVRVRRVARRVLAKGEFDMEGRVRMRGGVSEDDE